jgi:hypothetical protein
MALAIARHESAAQAKVEALSRDLAVTKEAVIGFLKIVTTSEVPFEKWPQALAEIAQRHVGLAENHRMVHALSTNRADQPLDVTVASSCRMQMVRPIRSKPGFG